MTTIVLTKQEWRDLSNRIKNEHGANFMLISWRVKRELGFSVRNHIYYNEFHERVSDMRLDFDDPSQATFFQLKYGCRDGQ